MDTVKICFLEKGSVRCLQLEGDVCSFLDVYLSKNSLGDILL